MNFNSRGHWDGSLEVGPIEVRLRSEGGRWPAHMAAVNRPALITLVSDVLALVVVGALASLGSPFVAVPPLPSALVLFGVLTLTFCWGLRLYARKVILQPGTAIVLLTAATGLAVSCPGRGCRQTC